MPIVALYSIKGGVGKTAAAVNLSHLASQTATTLIFDLDPQASTSFYFRIRASKSLKARSLVKGGKQIDRNIMGTDFPGLDLLPAKLSYRNLDIELDSSKKPGNRLTRMLKPLAREYTYIFIDCPPNLTLVSENVFDAADILLVPVIPTTLSLLTYEKLLRFFKKKRLREDKILAFFSMVEARKRLHQQTIEEMSGSKTRVLKSQIPYSAEVERMGVHREPLTSFRPRSRIARRYALLWQELKDRIDKQ